MQVEVPQHEADAVAKPEESKQEEVQIHTLLYDIKQALLQLEKAIANKEMRQVAKILKHVRRYKNVIQAHHLERLFSQILPGSGIDFTRVPGYNPEFKENIELSKNFLTRTAKLPEVEAYLRTLYAFLLYRQKNYAEALNVVKAEIGRISEANKRTLDSLNSFLLFLLARIYERTGNLIDIRQTLLEAYSKSCLKNDEIGQATLINLILRNYLAYNHYDAANNFIEMTNFPESKSTNEYCKFLYYTARVKAVRRDYTQSLWKLNQAIRKAPDRAIGFKITCQRLAIVVELLLGDIPNREIFSQEIIFKHTYGYYKIIQAVINGNLGDFNQTVEKYKQRFSKDRLLTLIMRLNQIVIRVGLRKINNSYSRISLHDVAEKLKIDQADVQNIVAKAIRDGVVTGEINHEQQYVIIKEHKNVYMTDGPQQALDKRIKYCLDLYQSIQRAITYPPPKIELEKAGSEDLDPNDLMDLFDFDDDM